MNTLQEEMIKQSQGIESSYDIGVFCCQRCKHYEGALKCGKAVFIAFEGANMTHCSFFNPGRKCIHCGRIT